MPIYDDAMAASAATGLGTDAASAPGTEAATNPVYVAPVPEVGDLGSIFEKTMGKTVNTNGTVRSGDRGPAMHADGSKVDKLVSLARSFVGTPYKWGGTTPSGFDCSGFVQYVYAKMGINLPRVSYQQATAGTIVGLGSLKAGDLVGWNNSVRNNGADHIAIYLGGGLIAEAPRPGVPLRIRRLDPNGYDKGAWGTRVL